MDHSVDTSQWHETDDGLYRQFEFADFQQAFLFMRRVADIAEAIKHHPRWLNDYNRVEIWLISHDAGDVVTGKDHELAAAIDTIASEYQ